MNDSTQRLPSGELFRHAEFLQRLARGLLRDEQAAEDVAQDAFVLALERPPQAQGSLSAWLARVVRNLAHNRRTSEQRRAVREELAARVEHDDTDQLAVERLELQRAVAELVLRLDEAKRTALYLRYYEGLEPLAIGARLGVPVKTVKTRLARALAELRAALDRRARGDRDAWVSALLPLAAQGGEPATAVLGGWLMKKTVVAVVLVLAAGVLWQRGREERPEPSTVASAARAPTALAEPPVEAEPRVTSAPAVAAPARAPAASGPATSATLVVQVVRQGTSEPLPGIGLVLHEAGAAWRFEPTGAARGGPGSLQTDADGRVEFQVTTGTSYRLRANPPGAARAGDADKGSWNEPVEPLAPLERRERVVALPAGFELVWCGQILDGESQLPLAGARVERVLRDPFTLHTGEATTRSAGDGRVRLLFAEWESCYARVELEGYAAGFVRLEKGHEQPATALPVRLLRAAALELTVTDPAGSPRAGVDVCASIVEMELVQGGTGSASLLADQTFVGRTDPRGVCVLGGLPAQEALTLELREGEQALRREERFLRLEPGERRALHWTVGGPCRLDGQIVEVDGRPAADVLLWVVPENGMQSLQGHEQDIALEARSDAQGRFTLELAAGAWLVGPAPESEVRASDIAPVGTSLVIVPGQESAEVRLTCWRGLYLRGRVLGPDGETISAGYVTAQGEGGFADDNFRQGEFAVGPLPGGPFVVRASVPGASGLAPSAGARFEAGTEGIELVLRRAASLSVRVLDARGSAVPDAMVWVLAAPGSEGSGGGTFTQGDGTASFPGLVPETYALSASSPAGEFALEPALALAAGEARDVELVLAPAARLRIEILPLPEPRMHVEILQHGMPVSLVVGSEHPVVPLAPGEYELVLKAFRGSAPAVLQRQRVRVAAEGETRAVFELDPPR